MSRAHTIPHTWNLTSINSITTTMSGLFMPIIYLGIDDANMVLHGDIENRINGSIHYVNGNIRNMQGNQLPFNNLNGFRVWIQQQIRGMNNRVSTLESTRHLLDNTNHFSAATQEIILSLQAGPLAISMASLMTRLNQVLNGTVISIEPPGTPGATRPGAAPRPAVPTSDVRMCPRCTFDNPPNQARCQMCDTILPSRGGRRKRTIKRRRLKKSKKSRKHWT